MLRNRYKRTFPFEKRKEEAKRILEKYPDRVPVICERVNKTVPDMDKRKFLVPKDITIGNFMYVIRKRMAISSDKSIFLFVNDTTLVPIAKEMGIIYDEEKDKDGFLYISYGGESTFG